MGWLLLAITLSASVSAAGVNYNETTFKPLVTSSDVVGQFTSCTGVQYLGADGACHDVSGSGLWSAVTGGINYAGGNVGIGTTNPSAKLNSQITANGTNAKFTLLPSGSGQDAYQEILFEHGNYGAIGASDIVVKIKTIRTAGLGGDLSFWTRKVGTGLQEVLTLKDNGNVGIGTTSPGAKLELGDGGSLKLSGGDASGEGNIQLGATASSGYDTNLIYLASTAGTGGFMFGSTAAFTAANGPYFGGRGNTYSAIAGQRGNLFLSAGNPSSPLSGEGEIRFNTGANQRVMTLTKDGNVGIGTTAPGQKLDVLGIVNIGRETDGSVTNLNITSGVAKISAFQINTDQPNSLVNFDTRNSYGLAFQMNDAEKMRILTNGNVGIGTTSPTEKLSVNGSMRIDGEIKFFSTDTPKIGGSGTDLYILSPGGVLYLGDGESDNNGVVLKVDDENSKFLFQNGKVGIGTTDPLATLQIDTPASAAAGNGLRINRPSSSYYSGLEYATAGTVDWAQGVNNSGFGIYENGQAVTTRLLIKDGGNVGIGTTNPTSLLDVAGDIHLADMTAPTTTTNKLYSVGGVLKWAGQTVATGTLSASSISEGDSSVAVTDTGTNGTITMKTDNATRMTIDNAGQVGIGTTDPDATLDLNGNMILGPTNQTDGMIQSRAQLIIQTDYDNNASSQYIAFKQRGNERMRIDTGGNVGIGVTSPAKKLHVNGGARFDNTSSTDAVELGSGKIYWDSANSELVIQVN